MDLPTLIPIASKVIGRDLSVELNLFYRARFAMGTAMTPEQQVMFIKNWPKLVDFMETQKGQDALHQLITAWEEHMTAPETK